MNQIDLHTHTTESDGTFTPQELIAAAVETGLRTLAITDHDTITRVEAVGLELIEGIELSCKYRSQTVHLLGYFFNGTGPRADAGFQPWLDQLLEGRRDRNRRLAERLRERGVDVHLEEAEQYGRRLTGRPHFARVLVAKGYAATINEAFKKYIGESGTAYVDRDSPGVPEAIGRITAAGGVASLAHPFRIHGDLDTAIAEFAAAGLPAIEAFHSDHGPSDTERYVGLAAKFGLAVSGGSDFHGANKPGIELGRGINGTLRIPEWVLPALRARSR